RTSSVTPTSSGRCATTDGASTTWMTAAGGGAGDAHQSAGRKFGLPALRRQPELPLTVQGSDDGFDPPAAADRAAADHRMWDLNQGIAGQARTSLTTSNPAS